MNIREFAKDPLKDVGQYTRRVIRRLVGYFLSALVSGLVMWLQEVILPDLQVLMGYDLYSALYVAVFGSMIAGLDVFSKKLREEHSVYLPF